MDHKGSLCLLVAAVLLHCASGDPVLGSGHGGGHGELPGELGRVAGRVGAHGQDPRLPLPSLQDLEAIKKVAEILVMLGQQVIPSIIMDQQPAKCDPMCTVDTTYDPVEA